MDGNMGDMDTGGNMDGDMGTWTQVRTWRAMNGDMVRIRAGMGTSGDRDMGGDMG